MIVIVTRISHFGTRVRQVARRRTVTTAPTPEGVRALLDRGDAIALVVIGEDVPLLDAIDFAAMINAAVTAPIVLVRYQPDLAVDAAHEAGIAQVVSADLAEPAIRELVDQHTAAPAYRDVTPIDANLAAMLDGPGIDTTDTATTGGDDAHLAAAGEQQLRPFDERSTPAPQLRLVGSDVLGEQPVALAEAEDDAELAWLLEHDAERDRAERDRAERERAEREGSGNADDASESGLDAGGPGEESGQDTGPVRLVGLDSLAQREPEPEPVVPFIAEHRVIVVLSPKGGVGKTTVSANLGAALGHRYRHQTVLVDLDHQFGDVASALGLSPQHTLEAAFTADGVQQPLVVKGLFNLFRDELFVLCGAESPAAMEHVGPEQVTALLSQLRDDYGFVVVDTGAGLSELTLAALEVATDVVVVASLDVSAIRSTRRALDLLRKLQLMPPRLHVVVNLADSGAGLSEQDVAVALDTEVDASVPRSTEVSLSMNIGEPLVVHRRSTPLAKATTDLVAKIVGEDQHEGGRKLFWKLGGR